VESLGGVCGRLGGIRRASGHPLDNQEWLERRLDVPRRVMDRLGGNALSVMCVCFRDCMFMILCIWPICMLRDRMEGFKSKTPCVHEFDSKLLHDTAVARFWSHPGSWD
jgi:hypothetical protein